jgi:hypothetical protein
MDAAHNLNGVATALEQVARNCDRIGTRDADTVAVVVRNLVSALDAARAGYPAALEVLAERTTGELFDAALVSAMGGAA